MGRPPVKHEPGTKLSSARAEARRLHAVRAMLHHLHGVGPLDEPLADAIERLSSALRMVRQLLTQE
jgi:hypothetical protein